MKRPNCLPYNEWTNKYREGCFPAFGCLSQEMKIEKHMNASSVNIQKLQLFSLNIISKVKFFEKYTYLQGQRYKFKMYIFIWKVLQEGICIWKINILLTVVQKLWPKLKLLENRSMFKVKVILYLVMVSFKGFVTKSTLVKYESPISIMVQNLWPKLWFF